MSVLQGRNLSMSLKKSKIKANLSHNRREYIPENADPSRQHLNVELKHGEPREEYKKVFGAALEEYNEKQKRKDRKIEDYYSHVYHMGGKIKPYEEFIIGLGKQEDWENATEDELKAGVEVVVEMAQRFQENNPSMHVINADVHGDEMHPHAHLIVVPVGDGYKRGMSKQVSFSKALENQGYRRTGFQEWRDDQMAALEDVGLKHGISRKLVGTNGYKDQEDYINAKEDIQSQENNLESLRSDLLTVAGEVKARDEKLEKEREEWERERKEIEAKAEQREKQVALKEEQADEKMKTAEMMMLEAKKIKEKAENYVKRFNSVLSKIDVHPSVVNGLIRFIQKGETGATYAKSGDKVPVSYLQDRLNKKVTKTGVETAIEQAAIEDDGPEL